MGRITIGGRVPRPDISRTPKDAEDGRSSVSDRPTTSIDRPRGRSGGGGAGSIPKATVDQLIEEHAQGMTVDLLALRWGLDADDIQKAINQKRATP